MPLGRLRALALCRPDPVEANMLKLLRTTFLGLLLASPTLPSGVQTAAHAQGEPHPAQDAPVPVGAPAPQWSTAAARELLAYVEGIGGEGLDPATYELPRLRAAIRSGDRKVIDRVATPLFLRLTRELMTGAVPDAARRGWRMPPNSLNGHDQQRLLAQAMDGGIFDLLQPLLPTHPQYLGLRRALAATPESERTKRDLIRTNMERWRWLPRDLGGRHVLVNVPAFTTALVESGRVVARHRVVVGKTSTPTPQLSATITGVTFNPWWNVPQSIIPELGRMHGYQVTRRDGRLVVRQPPGPRNALGRVKIEMPNAHAIYLHDTPAQALFGRDVRAFSHGCIRTEKVRDFAAALLAPAGQWDRAAIDAAIETGKTNLVELAEPVPIYIAYFTAAVTGDGEVVSYPDLYGRDPPVRQALNRSPAAA